MRGKVGQSHQGLIDELFVNLIMPLLRPCHTVMNSVLAG